VDEAGLVRGLERMRDKREREGGVNVTTASLSRRGGASESGVMRVAAS
jgi:hypothetical protein